MSDWILLRGLTRESRHWDHFETSMRAHGLLADDEHVVFIDLPGNGAEHELVTPATVEAMTAFVRDRVAELNVSKPCRVLAMSLGAMVACAWIQHVTEEIERLVLINTSMRPFAGVHERLRPSAWPMLARIARAWTQPEPCEQMIHTLTCNRTDTFDADVAQWAAWRRQRGASARNALRQLYAAARFRAIKFPPFHPTLLLSSAQDKLVDSACSTRIAKQWGVEHAVHPWAGHDLPHDDADWTCATIAAWLHDVAAQTDSDFNASADSPQRA
ncbi:hydrolase, alpha/beta fold family [Candidatus Burkholderia verschuerenii]|uniref:Hydrolase, alpha/beta fold family n=1 Tax=Candidatus Burkholderia verschuerenii TaxID=242163 RepID=A0A0L0M7D6_9BURK|nr:alpha/beta hydrolase [Candidatus Burkholderia verschuerenii]KND58293.1 hydrolase, alpha/beta fold family [Candidatus Burkholderia verschuerenii]